MEINTLSLAGKAGTVRCKPGSGCCALGKRRRAYPGQPGNRLNSAIALQATSLENPCHGVSPIAERIVATLSFGLVFSVPAVTSKARLSIGTNRYIELVYLQSHSSIHVATRTETVQGLT